MREYLQTWLHDILTCVYETESYFESYPKDFSEYQKNWMLIKATEKNQVIHGYEVVDDANIWSIVMNHLPKFKEIII